MAICIYSVEIIQPGDGLRWFGKRDVHSVTVPLQCHILGSRTGHRGRALFDLLVAMSKQPQGQAAAGPMVQEKARQCLAQCAAEVTS